MITWTGFPKICLQEKAKPVLVAEATVGEDFCAFPSLPMSVELGVLELLGVSVTALLAAGPPFRVLQQQAQGRVGAQRTFSPKECLGFQQAKDSGSSCAPCVLPRPVELTGIS